MMSLSRALLPSGAQAASLPVRHLLSIFVIMGCLLIATVYTHEKVKFKEHITKTRGQLLKAYWQ